MQELTTKQKQKDTLFFAKLVEEIKRLGTWRVNGYKSFGDWCQGFLGMTVNEVERMVSESKRLQGQGK